jgi:small subunit ribosomal protein S16
VLGTYDPLAASAAVRVNAERANGWLARGAQVTDTVRQLFKRSGVGSASPRAV